MRTDSRPCERAVRAKRGGTFQCRAWGLVSIVGFVAALSNGPEWFAFAPVPCPPAVHSQTASSRPLTQRFSITFNFKNRRPLRSNSRVSSSAPPLCFCSSSSCVLDWVWGQGGHKHEACGLASPGPCCPLCGDSGWAIVPSVLTLTLSLVRGGTPWSWPFPGCKAGTLASHLPQHLLASLAPPRTLPLLLEHQVGCVRIIQREDKRLVSPSLFLPRISQPLSLQPGKEDAWGVAS